MSRKKWVWSIVTVFIIGGVGLSAWWFARTPDSVKVKVAAAEPATIRQEVYATGTVTPVKEQQVTVMAPSKVAKVLVQPGDTVKTGQTLVQMDTTLADAQVAQAQAAVTTAQTNLATAQATLDTLQKSQPPRLPSIASAGTPAPSMQQETSPIPTIEIPMNAAAAATGSSADSGQASGTSLQEAQAAVSQAKAMLQQAQEGLKVAQAQRGQNIYRASINGTVLEVNAQAGSMAPMQSPLVVVGDLSKLQVVAQLNEVDAGKVQVGQNVNVTSKVIGDTPIEGIVSEIAPQAVSQVSIQGNASPSVAIKVNLPKVPPELKPGYSVDLNILTQTKSNVLAVPQEALFQEGGKTYVYQVVNQKLVKTEVNLGIANDTLQEVTSGLKAGSVVVLNPSTQLANGLPVSVETGSGAL